LKGLAANIESKFTLILRLTRPDQTMREFEVRDETAELVYPILDYMLELKARLDRGEAPSLEEEQANLGRLLAREIRAEPTTTEADESSAAVPIDDLRYALVCLIDEFFIVNTSWASAWNENKFETRRYGTNDRAWKFWRGANQALAVGDVEMAEVYFICLMLGFRGQMADDRSGLADWVEKARRLIETRKARLWSDPSSREPRTFVPPLGGHKSFESASLRLGIACLATVSLLVFVVVHRLANL
jgi:type VI secretion system protein ImpK